MEIGFNRTSNHSLERIVQTYGDLLFDLCESVLWSPSNAQVAFRSVLKEVRKSLATNDYDRYERALILKIACDRLKGLSSRYARQLTPAEQIELDASANLASRFKQFDHFFHRLNAEDQILLLLRDKYGLPYAEIATALSVPEASLKIRRQQALRALEEWLWDNR